MDHLKIIVADDHPLFRYGLECALTIYNNTCKIFHAGSGEEVLHLMKGEEIDVIFLDIRMPGMDGIATTKAVRNINKDVKIIAISMIEDKSSVLLMFRKGVNAYLHKAVSQKTIHEVLHAVFNNEIYLCEHLAGYYRAVKFSFQNTSDNTVLTERETEVLVLICQQYSTKEISRKLCLHEKTIETHRNHIMEKTNSRNMVGLALYAIEKGYIVPGFRQKEEEKS